MGLRVVTICQPMPHGDLREQVWKRFADYVDFDRHQCTIEEQEEYEPHIDLNRVVKIGQPTHRVRGDLLEIGQPTLEGILGQKLITGVERMYLVKVAGGCESLAWT